MRGRTLLLLFLFLISCLSLPTLAQNLSPTRVSPHANVSQRIGLSDITIDYHRPAVRDRAVWGALVPYGMSPGVAFGSGNAFPWRAGANENTTITFSHDVSINGQALKAGTYGLHMIPQEGEWTIIFSNDNASWGSFFYNAENDAARVTATPVVAGHQEWLMYGFEDMTASSTVAYLHWEKLKVPFKIEFDAHQIRLASMRKELTNLPAFGWQGPLQAANYCLQNNINHEEALVWVERSIGNTRNVNNMSVKAGLLDQLNRASESDKVRQEAYIFAKNTGIEADMNLVGYMYLQASKTDRAIDIFKQNVKKFPNAWNVYDSLADGYDRKGDKKKAIKYYRTALEKAPVNQKNRIQGILDRLEG
ncbi:MAG: DUF2911 domain-containing protein [Calditrichia bacterium]